MSGSSQSHNVIIVYYRVLDCFNLPSHKRPLFDLPDLPSFGTYLWVFGLSRCRLPLAKTDIRRPSTDTPTHPTALAASPCFVGASSVEHHVWRFLASLARWQKEREEERSRARLRSWQWLVAKAERPTPSRILLWLLPTGLVSSR